MEAQYPKTYFDTVRDIVQYLQESRANSEMSKDDAIDGMESRVSFLMTKMLAAPTATSFCVFRR